MKQADQHKFLFSKYHGIEKGTVSAVQLILAGEGRYAELWQTTTAAMELSIKLPGKLTTNSSDWYTKDSFSVASLSNTNNKSGIKISGRNISDKAKKALKNCKKYLAIYNSKLDSNGNLPSGKIEDDILFEVLYDLYQAKAGEKEDDSDAEDGEEELEDAKASGNVENQNAVPSSDDDNMFCPPGCTAVDDVGKILKVPSSFLPPSFWVRVKVELILCFPGNS
jgi:hypothetical protein